MNDASRARRAATRRRVVLALAGAWLGLLPGASWSQAFPSKPITLVVPTGAGGGTDVVARILSKRLGELLGQAIVVENRAGAGGIIGTQFVAKAPPDGHTLLISSNQIAMIPPLYEKAPFDPVKDFVPVTSLAMLPTVLVVNPKVAAGSVQELVGLARRSPDALTYGSAGNGSPNHLFAELFNKTANVKTLHVAYKGIAAALTDVGGGAVSIAFASLPTVQPLLASGKLRALAVTSPRRVASLPNVPAVAEAVPGYEAEIWIGLWAVAGTPAPVVARIHEAVVKTLADPEVAKRLAEGGMVVEPRSPEAFDAVVKAEIERWSGLITALGASIQKQ